jgi:alkyl sulfatase BDS1-like metallo-beta-lactamase superfamily hydrolase
MISPERSAGMDFSVGFRLGSEIFLAHVTAGHVAVRRAEPGEADMVFDSDPMSLASVIYGGRPLADAEDAGALRITGDRALAERFVTLFPLPPKMTD